MAGDRLKIAYLSGPANAPEVYREWSGNERQNYFGTDYLKQFLQLASDIGAQAYVVSWYGEKREFTKLKDFTFDNRPITGASGLRYYFDQIIWHLKVLFMLISFRPDVLLLTGNQNFWWVLSPIRWWGARIIASYHAVLWPKLLRPSAAWAFTVRLNGRLILRHAATILVTSNDIRRQVEKVLAGAAGRVDIVHHLPTYSREQFAEIKPPPVPSRRPFHTLFLGRIVENKGVFDIVEIARDLESEDPGQYRFDLCGNGEQLDTLRRRVAELGLEDKVICHGFCGPEQIRALMDESHICIVPTRSDCEAGFEMTCAEAVLAGRPLVTSPVCPALEYLGPAAVEAKPDDSNSYRQAIVQLSRDPTFYECKRGACAGLQEQFYDPRNSWYTAMKSALERHLPTVSERNDAKAKIVKESGARGSQ